MKLQKSFEFLHQRIFYNYKLCFSPFQPIDSNVAGIDAQKEMHKLCEDIIDILYIKPELMNIDIQKDDCFELYVCNNRKPELSKTFRKTGELMKSLYHFLCFSGLKGELQQNTLSIELDQKQMKEAKIPLLFLPHLGIKVMTENKIVKLSCSDRPFLFEGMKLLSTVNVENNEITGQSLFGFAMGIFNRDTDYLIHTVENEMDLEYGFFTPYFKQMMNAGYVYKHQYGWYAEGPGFGYKFDNGVSGFDIYFNMIKIHQIYFALSSQIGVKAICEEFDNQPEQIKEYLFDRLYDCNDCMGCTKGGKNAKFAVQVSNGDVNRNLCPNSMWIGHQIEYMNDKVMNILIEFSSLQAKYGNDWRKAKKK